MGLNCRNRSGWVVACGAVLSLSLSAGAGHAQTVSPTDEYRKLIAAGQSIQPLGSHPFGEMINLYNGGLSFEVTDISVPGTGPTLQLSRSLDAAESGEPPEVNLQRPFGDWDLDIPRMETYTAYQYSTGGWTVGGPTNLARCTYFQAPSAVPSSAKIGEPDWQPSEWWYGYHLIIPGNGSQYVGAGGGSDLTPSVSGLTFTLSTKEDWRIACGVTASDGGEGFLAIAPDGTRYTFAQLLYRPVSYINRTTDLGTGDTLARRDAFMYVTQVEDRFGNTLTYNWSGNNLTSIVASDGRELDFGYNTGTSLIHTITLIAAGGASARTWTYTYASTSGPNPTLTKAQLPDGSAWSYALGTLQTASLTTNTVRCPSETPFGFEASTATGSMTTPSGLTATFTLTPMLHSRSYVPEQCIGDGNGAAHPSIPDLYAQFSLTQEVQTGPGIPSGGWTWSWSYSSQTALNASWTSDTCASSNNCPDTVYTDARDPLGQVTRYTYSNRFDLTEGKLLQVDRYSGAAGTTELQSVVNTYADPTGKSWPWSGVSYVSRVNIPQIEDTSPLQSSTTTLTQQGTSFSTSVNTFDNLARATSKTESSSLGYSKTDTTTYSDDVTDWVLGSVTKTTTNGITVSQTNYNSLDQPTTEYAFGRLASTKGWNSDGTLQTIQDGDSHTTTFSNWYRGLPKNIAYVDGTTQSAGVDGNGWLTSVTDENGFTTGYGYDAMGRIASITYPSGDDVAWNQTLLTFAPVSSSEFGIPAGHWKQTIHTGGDYTVTYFDAFWRPLLTEHYDSGNSSGTMRQVVRQYDGDGHTVFASYPTNSVSTYTQSLPGTHTVYDTLDRVTEVDADSELGTLRTLTQYLPGFQTEVTDPRGYATTTSYQAYGEADTSSPVSIAMPEGATTSITRDVFGKPLSITRSGPGSPSVTRHYAYNGFQQLCGLTEPETNTTAYGYDGEGNLTWSAPGMTSLIGSCYVENQASSAGREVKRTYDGRNQLRTVTYPDGSSTTSLGYDPDGVLATQTNNNGGSPVTTTYGHDKRRLLKSEAVTISSAWSFTLGYGYDVDGHLATTTYPDQRSVTYAPNALGEPTRAGSYATGATYYPDGAIESYTYGNSLVHMMSENARLLPGRVTDAYGGAAVHDDGYGYDADGDVSVITDYTAGNVGNRNMTYDGLDRLTEADSPMFGGDDKSIYTYDAVDNLRSARVGSGISYGYTYDAINRLHQLTNTATGAVVNTYTYDAQGNLASKNSQAYQFDMADRLRAAPGLGNYLYDAAGRRVQKTETGSGRLLYSMYSNAGQLMFQWEPATQNGTDYIYLGDSLVARVIGNNSQVLGNIDGAPTTANPTIGGWACSSGLTQSIDVQLFVGGPSGGGGTRIGTYTANQPSESAVATSCGAAGANYRFSIPLAAATDSQYAGSAIYIYGNSPVGNSNNLLSNSGQYTVPPNAGAPSAPGTPTQTGATATSVSVSWSAATDNVGVTSYQYRINGGTWASVGNVLSTTVTGLSPLTTYAFSVRAGDAAGNWGLPSSASVTTSADTTPPSAPGTPGYSNLGMNSATVSWTAATDNVSVSSYQYQVNGGAATSVGNALTVSLSGLAASTNYTVAVSAKDEAGNVGPASSVTFRTLDTVPPSAPGVPTVSGITATSAHVSWAAATDNVGVTHYAYQLNGGTWTSLGNVTSTTVSGLQGVTSYTIAVRAYDAAGNAGPSSTATFTTAQYADTAVVTAGNASVAQGEGFRSDFPYGSISPTTTTNGYRYYYLYDVNFCTAKGGCSESGNFAVSGFSSNPGQSWLTSVSCGVTQAGSSASYSFASGVASWTWPNAFGFVSGSTTTCTITHK